jgi:hypothetical protein
VCLGAHSGDWSSAFANAEHQGDDQEKQAKDLHGAKARGKQHGYVGRLARRYDSISQFNFVRNDSIGMLKIVYLRSVA